ncbi:MAG TPA: transglutaminase family protein [Leptolyngbyaceae cyanobacterium]
MRYSIRHLTCYHYSQPVSLKPHVLRLRPRSDGTQVLQQFHLSVTPEPTSTAQIVELDGNGTISLWFGDSKTEKLCIETYSEVKTFRTNPFSYLAEPWAAQLPIDYPISLATSLQPYLSHPLYPSLDPGVVQLAQSLLHEINGNVSYFLTTLTQRIYESCEYLVRESGPPLPAGITWTQKRGSCRDFAVLFIAACQSAGLAARFVSGYQEGDLAIPESELHAWVEVYVPGGGWRGFDPTHGLAVSDRHIALVASPHPYQAAPVSGAIQEGSTTNSTLETHITIEAL